MSQTSELIRGLVYQTDQVALAATSLLCAKLDLGVVTLPDLHMRMY